jgi:hypothetical protein
MAHKKVNLPEKVCPICERPFTWRKRWEKQWDDIKYCSERCRRKRNTRK